METTQHVLFYIAEASWKRKYHSEPCEPAQKVCGFSSIHDTSGTEHIGHVQVIETNTYASVTNVENTELERLVAELQSQIEEKENRHNETREELKEAMDDLAAERTQKSTLWETICELMEDDIKNVDTSELGRLLSELRLQIEEKDSELDNARKELKETKYTRSRITRTCLYRIIAYFEGHLPHQKSLH